MTAFARGWVPPFAIAFLVLTIGLIAQPPTPPTASFTIAQAEAGRAAYDASCSGCHLRDLKGAFEAPQLAGSTFSISGATRPSPIFMAI